MKEVCRNCIHHDIKNNVYCFRAGSVGQAGTYKCEKWESLTPLTKLVKRLNGKQVRKDSKIRL